MLADASGSSSSATATITIQPISGYLLVNKHSSEPVLQGDGTFIWKYFISMTNVQTSPIDNVHVTDDLSKVFASPISFTVTGITATGNLNANTLYDGVNHTNLLVDVSSLAANTKDSVTIELKVDPHEYVGPVYNQAEFDGTLGVLGMVSNVLSDDPANTGSTAARRPTVTNIPLIDIKIPNAFSPNNDGFNDTFVINTSSDVQVSLEVFNRWGAQVYKNKSYQNEWDGKGTGTLLGSNLSEGTYYYTVETTHKITHEVKKYSGFITLKR
jgi:gliding motility-associated-like protein